MESGVILIVDDDPDMAFLERRSLERAGYAVSIASSTAEARRVIERGGVRLIVLDQRLSGGLTGPGQISRRDTIAPGRCQARP